MRGWLVIVHGFFFPWTVVVTTRLSPVRGSTTADQMGERSTGQFQAIQVSLLSVRRQTPVRNLTAHLVNGLSGPSNSNSCLRGPVQRVDGLVKRADYVTLVRHRVGT